MHNFSEHLSQSAAPSKRVAKTTYKLPLGVSVAMLAALFAARGIEKYGDDAAGAPTPIKAPQLDDVTDVGPVSALSAIEEQPASPAILKPVSMEKKVPEKAPVKPGQLTIEELPEGVVPANTPIRLRAGGKEGGQEYILVIDEKGLITINGKKYEQAAKAYKDFPLVGKKLVKTVVLKWSEVKKVHTEKGESVLEINGEPIDKSEEGKVDLYTEDELVSMGANADSGKLVKPLGKRLGENPLTGKKDVEVDVDWTIYPAKK